MSTHLSRAATALAKKEKAAPNGPRPGMLMNEGATQVFTPFMLSKSQKGAETRQSEGWTPGEG